MANAALLDFRWTWLRTALRRLYAELDPGAADVSLTLCVRYDDGSLVAYVLTPELAEVARSVVINGPAVLQGFEDGTARID